MAETELSLPLHQVLLAASWFLGRRASTTWEDGFAEARACESRQRILILRLAEWREVVAIDRLLETRMSPARFLCQQKLEMGAIKVCTQTLCCENVLNTPVDWSRCPVCTNKKGT